MTNSKSDLVVDADTHFWQPIEIWQDHIDSAHRASIMDFIEHNALKPDTSNVPGMKQAAEAARRLPADDPVARLEWMDSEEIDVCIIFPSFMNTLCYAPDPDVAAAACRGLNRWAAEFARHAPTRLKPCMVLPWYFPERALEEFEVARELGLDIAFVSPTPSVERNWSDPALDPVWGALERSDTALMFHEFTRLPAGSTHTIVARSTYTFPMKYLCGHTVELQLGLMDMVLGGVLDRFPKLRLGFVEGHAAWLPGWLDMLDTAWERPVLSKARGDADPGLLPSELFRRQGFVVAFPEDRALDVVIERVGPQVLLLSTDYPHPNATYNLIKRFDSSYPMIGDDDRRRALGGNAARIFGLDT